MPRGFRAENSKLGLDDEFSGSLQESLGTPQQRLDFANSDCDFVLPLVFVDTVRDVGQGRQRPRYDLAARPAFRKML